MAILAIDPGPTESAWVLLDGDNIFCRDGRENEALCAALQGDAVGDCGGVMADYATVTLAIEYMESRGMPAPQTMLDTQFWVGQFARAWRGKVELVKRREVKLAICGDTRAKAANIRQALIDMYGGKEKAIGKKRSPGPLYGIKGDHLWAALAVAMTVAQRRNADEQAR